MDVLSFRRVADGQVQISLPAWMPCPCGSGVITANCCLTSDGFVCKPASTTPVGESTEFSLKSCYASRTRNCCPSISREHYVSESLLKCLNGKDGLAVSGLSWLDKDEIRTLRPNSLASKVLCERHNAALSPLDAIAMRLFQSLEPDFAQQLRQSLTLFSGHDVERWLLKILCGMAASHSFRFDNDVDDSVPALWLEILFGEKTFGFEQGLYVCTERNSSVEAFRGIKVRAITREGNLSGVGVWIAGYEFILSMTGFPSRGFDGRTVAYRPSEFYMVGADAEASVWFSWEGEADFGTVTVRLP